MRHYDLSLLQALQHNVRTEQVHGVRVHVKPIPDCDAPGMLDPRLVPIVQNKMAHFVQPSADLDQYQINKVRHRPDKVSEDLCQTQVTVRERLVPIGRHYINVCFYAPEDLAPNAPAIIFLHGGGFTAGDGALYRNQCKLLCEKLGGPVIFPEYRLAPENPFPCGLEDCFGTLCWVHEHAAELCICLLYTSPGSGGFAKIPVPVRAASVPAGGSSIRAAPFPCSSAVTSHPGTSPQGRWASG